MRAKSTLFAGAFLFGSMALGPLTGCQVEDEPAIVNVDVEPDTWEIGGLADDVQFTISADVINFDNELRSVVATVEDTDLNFNLRRTEDIAAGERWEHSENLTVWSDFSVGTYYISVTATDMDGDSVTAERAAQVVVTD